MCASIDGIGLVGEFVRTGLDWDPWDKNSGRCCTTWWQRQDAYGLN